MPDSACHAQIHKLILAECQHRFDPEISAEQRLRILFKNFRQMGDRTHGLRLSGTGHKVLSRVFTCWEFNYNKLSSNKTLIDLDSNMTWPYYLGRGQVAFYSEIDAAMFKLTGGELESITDVI